MLLLIARVAGTNPVRLVNSLETHIVLFCADLNGLQGAGCAENRLCNIGCVAARRIGGL